jgi:hypothetical protein
MPANSPLTTRLKNAVVNPPPCRHCGEPVLGVNENSDTEKWYHGDCYREHANLTPGPVAPQSHDELVTDGLEWP